MKPTEKDRILAEKVSKAFETITSDTSGKYPPMPVLCTNGAEIALHALEYPNRDILSWEQQELAASHLIALNVIAALIREGKDLRSRNLELEQQVANNEIELNELGGVVDDVLEADRKISKLSADVLRKEHVILDLLDERRCLKISHEKVLNDLRSDLRVRDILRKLIDDNPSCVTSEFTENLIIAFGFKPQYIIEVCAKDFPGPWTQRTEPPFSSLGLAMEEMVHRRRRYTSCQYRLVLKIRSTAK
jgi:hypothetical protein